MINLTKEQSIQLEKTGECWHIELIKEQPILENGWYFYKNIKFNKKAIIEELAGDRKYQLGQKVKISMPIGNVKIKGAKLSDNISVVNESHATVTETEKPIRVQDIDLKILIDLFPDSLRYFVGPLRLAEDKENIDIIKDYFNKIFAEPKAVECDYVKPKTNNMIACKGDGYLQSEYNQCPNCNGTGISHYVYYIYDEESKIMNEKLSVYWDHNRGEYFCKNKSLKIILNPWVEIIKIKRK